MIIEIVVGRPPWGWEDFWIMLAAVVTTCVVVYAYIKTEETRL